MESNEFDWIKDVKMDTHLEYPETWTNEKLSRKDARTIKHLTYKYAYHYWDGGMEEKRKVLEHRMEHYDDSIMDGRAKELYEIFVIADKYNITMSDLAILWSRNCEKRKEYRKEYSRKPQKEGRDNKGVYVGSGGGNRNRVRYPKKNRSRATWKKFYEMFPYYAERDGWDGRTSKRMK